MDEKKLIPTLNRPFDVIYSCNKSGNWLAKWDDFGRIDWYDGLDCPEVVLLEARALLEVNK